MTQVALVTGGGSGIGRHSAHALANAGFTVIVCGRTQNSLNETASGFDNIHAISADITDEKAVDSMMSKLVADHGRLDVVFNNAGNNVPAMPIDELTVEQWRTVIDVNLNGAFLIARAAFGQMRKQSPQGGRIINNGSISAHVPRPGSVPYTTSKHAITGLTRTLSLDGRAFNIACGQIDIGNAASAMTEKMNAGVPQADGTIKSEPTMDVQHIADAVVNMASLPLEANIQFMTIMASSMPFIGRG
ncbi:MAG: SDR family oxidoreductase [Gammaproteobacteria bacterium]|nr:SDR family oxidoreductase [Gammaproteobacteria bacterium]